MLKKIINKIRKHTFPTPLDRWFSDHGDQTLRLDYPLNNESLVLDFGGYEGEWADSIDQRYGSRIIVFEPVPEYAENIVKRFEGKENIDVCAYGLGSGDRIEKIHLSDNASSSFITRGKAIDMHIKDASNWFCDRQMPTVALAKLNIEGGEYDLLERLIENNILPLINHIQIQFHQIAPDSGQRRKQIQDALTKTHDLIWCYEFVWESWSLRQPSKL